MSCEIELLRFEKIKLLKKYYKDLCKEYLNLDDVPKSSFGRWLIEMISYDNLDPIIPSTNEKILFNPIYYEIAEDLPGKITLHYDIIDNDEDLDWYIHEYLKLLYKLLIIDDFDNIIIYEKCIKYYKKIYNIYIEYKNKNIDYEKTYEIFGKIKNKCKLELIKLMDKKIKKICSLINIKSMEYAKEVAKIENKKNDKIYKKNKYKYIILSYNHHQISILKSVYDNLLRKMYRVNNIRIWIMYQRYKTLMIDEKSTSLQAAVPYSVMEYLKENFDVYFECFASPINSYFCNYCSAFEDTDKYFGSKGNFFNYKPDKGSFEVNPPFSEHIMIRMVNHIHYLLSNTTLPMSFIIFLPNWEDSEALIKLNLSEYNRKDFLVEANKHSYRGSSREKEFKAVHDTHIYILQNDEGYKKWKPTKNKIEGLIKVFNIDK